MTKTKPERADGRLVVSAANATLVRLLASRTGETQDAVFTRVLRGHLCRALKAHGIDPDRVIAEHEAKS